MSGPCVVLINSNRMQPPVAPLALDYIGDTLLRSGYDIRVIDLCFADDERQAIREGLNGIDPIAIGITFRNTDDCYLLSQACFTAQLRETISHVRNASDAPIILGGCGYSIFPAAVLDHVDGDFGIAGDGEQAMLQLVRKLEANANVKSLPGLVYRDGGGRVMRNASQPGRLLNVPTSRGLIDNVRYFREGAQGNVETKRGCPMNCLYCADPVAKGRQIRRRAPGQIADEFESLYRQGIDVLHLCDGEFNIPPDHAIAVCEELVRRNVGDKVQWYCYASVHPFPAELADLMQRAGCVGINFGADSGSDIMLDVLQRGYVAEAIAETVGHCKRAGLLIMIDLLLGGPGETEATVRETIDFVKRVDPDRCGAATGIRVYPGTPLAEIVHKQGAMAVNPNLRGCVEDNDCLLSPVFFVDQGLGDQPAEIVCDAIGDDPRFFPPPRIKDRANYNYNDNSVLVAAIAAGHRGAYWDILRRLTGGLGPLGGN